MSSTPLTWVEVDLGAIARNFHQLQGLVGPASPLMPMVKSNAYGHGLLPVARTVVACGARMLGVASVEEALALRDGDIHAGILVVSPVHPNDAPEVVEQDISVAVFDLETARRFSEASLRRGRRVRVHAKIDTGLGRLSVTPEGALSFIEALRAMEGLELEGVYTHLADAEGIDQSMTLRQFVNFKRVLHELEEKGIRVPMRHMSGSAAAMLMPELRYDLVRAGIALYGLWPSEETRILMISRGQNLLTLLSDEEIQQRGVKQLLSSFLQPALAFRTRVAQVKEVPCNWSIGYGCTFQTRRDTRIAVLPVGYADGYDRHLSNNGYVLVRGLRAPVVGRVSMNLTTVDVTDIAGVSTDDVVTLIGNQGSQEITAEEVANRCGTINYEVVTRIRWDLPRAYQQPATPMSEAASDVTTAARHGT